MINVGEWIKKWSTIRPNKTVLISEGRQYTYQELDRRINQTSHLLLKMGIQKGDRVSVLLHNCHQYLEIFFALSKIGAILVPLNWRLAGPELEFIINDIFSVIVIF
jgi:fatty-acyl-CoA synthase